MTRALALFLMTLAFAAAALAPARGEDLRYPHLERLFQQRDAAPRRASRPVATPPRLAPRRIGGHAAGQAGSLASRPNEQAPDIPVVPKTYFVDVLGDAMGTILADGLAASLQRERPQVEIVKKTSDESGVVRADYYDWGKAAAEIAASGERLDYVVVMMGANDRQPIRDADGTSLDPFSDRWREVYGARVERIVEPFRARGIPVAWVGLPIMKSERYGADILKINEVARNYAEKAGASFIDVWERFADEAGRYSADGPDVSGRMTRLRTGDGVYLTHAGALKLAHFVQGDIVRLAGAPPVIVPSAPQAILAVAPDAPPPPPAPEIDAGAIIRQAALRDASPANGLGAFNALPLPEALPIPFFPTRPLAGPVAALTAPPVAVDGKLVSAPIAAAIDAPSAPKRGRADDFVWPRP